MRVFIVGKMELWEPPVVIEARNEQQALKSVEDGEGITLHDDFEYKDAMPPKLWRVDDITDE